MPKLLKSTGLAHREAGRLISSRGLASNASPARKKLVILGPGWGGNRLARRLDQTLYDVTIVSPANHFLVTPLLPQTALGTLEFGNVQEPVRSIKGIKFYQAKGRSLDWLQRTVECEECIADHRPSGHRFSVGFDVLVIATGCKTHTFGIQGVAEAEGKEVASTAAL